MLYVFNIFSIYCHGQYLDCYVYFISNVNDNQI